MTNIKVSKSKLLEILKSNRKEHRELFVEAQKKYREAVIETLDGELKRARDGQPFVIANFTRLITPSDHTSDYDRVIGMLEMDLEKTVELSQSEYSCYVDDNWGWMHQFSNEVTSYGVSNEKMARFSLNRG